MGCNVVECTVKATSSNSGGLIGEIYNSNVTVGNSVVKLSTVLGSSGNTAGLVATMPASSAGYTANVYNSQIFDTNIKGSNTLTFAPIYDAATCTASGVTNVANLRILFKNLDVTTSQSTNVETYSLVKQGAAVSKDSTGYVNPALGYLWTWGDGTTATTMSNTPTHAFTAFGNYTTDVNIINQLDTVGSSGSVSFTLYGPSATIVSPTKDTKILTGETYQFVSNVNYATGFLWNFGDGATATTQNTTHIYAASGEYNITLTVTNPYGSETISLGQQSRASTYSYTVEDVTGPATAAMMMVVLIPLALAGILVFGIVSRGSIDISAVVTTLVLIGAVIVAIIIIVLLSGSVDQSAMNILEIVKGFGP
jgi:hypothetical protein